MDAPFTVRLNRDALVLSFSTPARVLSWALLNGGFCRADHLINHHVDSDDTRFCAAPEHWLEEATAQLGLNGKIVAMATAVEMKNLIQLRQSTTDAEVTCFATVGCGNALAVGDPTSAASAQTALPQLHTINLILTVGPGLCDEALVEAIQIATEGRVRALYEAGIRSSMSDLTATGTGTDCIAIASLGLERARYCGKHTHLGEFIGRATYLAVRQGIAATLHR
jgi:adenosylcobinamide amidohydrolase